MTQNDRRPHPARAVAVAEQPPSERVQLAQGGGGEATKELLETLVLPRLTNPLLAPLTDAAVLPIEGGRLCFATDASVVQPLEFPGGDIGRLAVCGTVNDLAMMGAKARALTISLILEEGLELALLARIVDSIARAAKEAGVPVVAGDTKVIERQSAARQPGLTISTAGIGLQRPGAELGLQRCAPGDIVLVSGEIGDHGLTLLAERDGLSIDSALNSDVAPLVDMALSLCELGPALRFLRDPTRGGLAGVLVDIAEGSGQGLEVCEEAIPVAGPTRHIAELLGIDPLVVANEGKLVAVCAPEAAALALARCRAHPLGKKAAQIGELVAQPPPPLVELLTIAGGRRIVRRANGEELPRIC